MRIQITYPDGSRDECDAVGSIIRIGRDPVCEVAFDPARFPKVSSLHAQIEQTPSGLVISPKSKSNKTLLNDRPLDDVAPLAAGDRIRLGYTGPVVQIAAIPTSMGDHGNTVLPDAAELALLRGTAEAKTFELGPGGVVGRDPDVAFVLDHPHVSRRHARITTGSGRVILADLGSANGTYVNGGRIGRSVELHPGDRIEIGPFSLQFDGKRLASRTRSNNVELTACGLSRVVIARNTGESLTLIDDLSLVVRPREFVCLIGPSGSGKSTLLGLLSGRSAPDDGMVLVNGRDLHEDFAALKQDIAVVPQTEAIHAGLTVTAALGYTAELRLPPDTGRDETEQAVADLLDVVGLGLRRDTVIRHLSGGQLKLASLANELISRPSLLFLDEATSGLDEQTDREVMEVFRKVADAGKTVVCITHNLANVEATCHLVAILTEGGRLAFVGTPDEALQYFNIRRLGDVYKVLSGRKPDEWKAAYRASPLHQRYVQDRMPRRGAFSRRRIDAGGGERRPGLFHQLGVLTRRYIAVCLGDRSALLTMIGQGLLVGALVAIVFGELAAVDRPMERVQKTINLLFILNVSCFWLGCNNAAKEVVKERVIYTRERDFNLRADAYLASKLVVLLAIGLLQVTILFAIARAFCGPTGAAAAQWGMLAALMAAGTSLGLALSALSRSQEVALALVPIAVIPQIILANAIVSLSGFGKLLGAVFITCYWAEAGLESLLPPADLDLLGRPKVGYFSRLVAILAHAAAFSCAAWFCLNRRNKSSL